MSATGHFASFTRGSDINTSTNMKPIHKQTVKIGQNKGQKRVCLWSVKMIEAGFDFGTQVELKATANKLVITASKTKQRNKVSRVMNHGKPLPVLDLRGKHVEHLGEVGDVVSVRIDRNKITIVSNIL